jgi:selenocysteine lyase/cysteine desulfurase
MEQTYLNNAAAAFPLIPGVMEAVTECMRVPPQVSGRDASGSKDILSICRGNLARLLNVKSDQIVLTCNATYGLNNAILGIGLKPGDFVITSVMEHNSVLRPLKRLEKLNNIRIAYVPLDSEMKLDSDVYDTLLEQEPRGVGLSHASNVTGRINPVAVMFEKAKAKGAVTLLDASQTVGRFPVLPEDLNADMVVFPGYKGLRGPLGTGVLYVSPQVGLSPVFVGGTGVKSDLLYQPDEMPMRLESGTPNLFAFAGLNAAVLYIIEKAGKIISAEQELTKELYEKLAELEKVKIYDSDFTSKLPTVVFNIAGMDAEEAGFALSQGFGIQCRAGLHCAPLMQEYLGGLPGGTVRFSASFMNTKAEIEYAVDAVRRL